MNMILDGVSVFIVNWQLTMGILALLTVFILPLFSRKKLDVKSASTSMGIALALFVLLSLILRLAYISKTFLPSYFDSAQHYSMIKGIMTNGLLPVYDISFSNYYHMGFHFLTAFFASVFQTEIATTMLVLGQIILAVLPLPFFFIVKYVTHSNLAGMFAVVLSAFGWYMPAHAVDWGKYPALMSVGFIPFVFCLVCLLFKNDPVSPYWNKWVLYGFIGFNVFATVISHSRSLIVLCIVLLAWKMSVWWRKLHQIPKRLTFFFLLAIFILEAILIEHHDILSLLFDPYISKGIMNTSIVIFLSIFAYRSFPQLTFINVALISLLLASLFIPVPGLIPGHPRLTLMDRPYIEILLFLPLALLGGLGLAGLEKRIKSPYQKYTLLSGIGLIMFHAIANYEFYPSDCCVIVGNDDVTTMAWIDDQLPVNVRIGISSTELKVIPTDVKEGYVGADAGIWITPLTDRATILLPYDSEFDQPSIFKKLCELGIGYLYVGELGQPFNVEKMVARQGWYRLLLSTSGTRVYEVIGCGN